MSQNEVICTFLYQATSYPAWTFIWRSNPFLVRSCVNPGLLTEALITSGKGRLSGSSDTPGQEKKHTDQSKRMPFALHGVSAPFQEVRS